MNDNYHKLTKDLLSNILFTSSYMDATFYIDYISKLAHEYINSVSNNSFNNRFFKKEYLDTNSIFLIAREIIRSIDLKYVNTFDYCLEHNLFNINKYKVSKGNIYIGYPGIKQTNPKINLFLENTYYDILTLVHEFIHFVAINNKNISRPYMLLTEFYSIYYEDYALEYLKHNQIDLDYTRRIYATLINANDYLLNEENYLKIIKSFLNNGKVDREKLYYEYGYDFDFIVSKMLNKQENIKFRYRSFPYIIGTILTYYVKDKYSRDIIKNSLDNINNSLDINDFILYLKEYGIDITNVDLVDLLKPIKERKLLVK